jgi:hypothetical protein
MILDPKRARKFSTLMALTVLLLAGVTAVSLYRVRSQCGERLTRKDIVIDRKIASPNGSKLLIDYRFDLGALGYSASREVVIPVERMGGDLTPFRLPEKYTAIKWEPDESLAVQVNLVQCIVKNWDCSQTSDASHGTRLNIHPVDDTTGKRREVEADVASPDDGLRLVAYRYPSDDRSNLGPIHISIIRAGEPIPRYGNYYIASGSGDGVLGARWNGNSSIVLLTNSSQRYLLEYAESFRHGPTKIAHSIEIDNRLHGYLWVSKQPDATALREQQQE